MKRRKKRRLNAKSISRCSKMKLINLANTTRNKITKGSIVEAEADPVQAAEVSHHERVVTIVAETQGDD